MFNIASCRLKTSELRMPKNIEPNTSAISLSEVYKQFQIGKIRIPILQDLNFTVRENEFVILSGPSGSGKSTILSIIGGLTRIDKGEIMVLNHDLQNMSEEDLAIFRSTYVGFVFQTGHLLASLTVLENILLPIELASRHIEDLDFETRAKDLINEFKLTNREASLPAMISGGEYQRTAFIRSLILDPDLILIDEPTSNQDQVTTQIIINKLKELKGKKTIICVTHDRKIFPLADRILLPQTGKLIPFTDEEN